MAAEDVSLREYLDQRLADRQTAAEVLREEERRDLDRAIHEGDERLREHISNQILQIHAALVSSDKLEIERVASLRAELHGYAAQFEQAQATDRLAETKFETDVAARFASVNEFRAALADLGKEMATRRDLESVQAVAQERYETIQGELGNLRSRLDVGPAALPTIQQTLAEGAGRASARADGRESVNTTVAVVGSVVGALILLLGILNYTSLHKSSPPTQTVTVSTPTETTTTATP